MKCHDLFDVLWKSGKLTRREAYIYLTERVGVAHIGGANEEECLRIIKTLKGKE